MLTKARSIEAEKCTSTSAPTVSAKSAAHIDSDSVSQGNDLSKQMSELITIVKNQQAQMSKDQTKVNNYNGQDKKFKGNRNGGTSLRGPDTNSSEPFRNGVPPIQCYNCGGWGQKAQECPSLLNFQRERLPITEREKNLPSAK